MIFKNIIIVICCCSLISCSFNSELHLLSGESQDNVFKQILPDYADNYLPNDQKKYLIVIPNVVSKAPKILIKNYRQKRKVTNEKAELLEFLAENGTTEILTELSVVKNNSIEVIFDESKANEKFDHEINAILGISYVSSVVMMGNQGCFYIEAQMRERGDAFSVVFFRNEGNNFVITDILDLIILN